MDILLFAGKVLLLVVICYFISSVVHELGHVIVGIMNGWTFYILVIGPFKWKRDFTDGKVKFQLEKNVAMWGGIGRIACKRQLK